MKLFDLFRNPEEIPSENLNENIVKGKQFENNGHMKPAIKLYKYNIKHRHQDDYPYIRLAEIYYDQKKYSEALDILRKALDVFRTDVPEYAPDRELKIKKIINYMDKINGAIQDMLRSAQNNHTSTNEPKRLHLDSSIIEEEQRIDADPAYRNEIIKKYYQDYPEFPFISKDRQNNTNWIESTEVFPRQNIIPKSMMTRYSDGLLPGHVYMLYWIDKQNRKRIPSYFEYTYGINFYKEKNFLEDKGYIIDDKITELGKKAITSHYEVIEAKHPKPKNTGNASKSIIEFSNCGRKISIPFSNGRLRVPISDKPVILREIQQLNQAIELAKRLSGIKANLAIDGNELCFTDPKMFYEFHNLTPKGRETKSPLTLHYVCSGHNDANSPKDYFGEISYARDGKIYSAKLIFWKYKKGYMIHIGTNKNQTLIKKVEISENFKWIVKYKCV